MGHHVIPKSRGGRKGRVVEIPDYFHKAWHALFENLYGEEVVQFIREVNQLMNETDLITGQQLQQLRSIIRRDKK